MGRPGWPEFACCTASIARVRIVLMQSVSSCCPVAKTCSLATMRFRSSHWRFPPARSAPQRIRVSAYRKGCSTRESVSISTKTWIEHTDKEEISGIALFQIDLLQELEICAFVLGCPGGLLHELDELAQAFAFVRYHSVETGENSVRGS